jgi:hypothetical protein
VQFGGHLTSLMCGRNNSSLWLCIPCVVSVCIAKICVAINAHALTCELACIQSFEYQRVLDGELAQRADINRQLKEVSECSTVSSASYQPHD